MKPWSGKRAVLWAAECHFAQECRADLFQAAATLTQRGCRVQAVFSRGELRGLLSELSPDLIVACVCGRSREPIDLLRQIRAEEAEFPPVLLMAGATDLPLYLEGMRNGAFDCLALPAKEGELARLVSKALGAREPEAAAV